MTPTAKGPRKGAIRPGVGADDPGQYLPALARVAAERRRGRSVPLRWSEALAEAPWDTETMPPAWETEFRRAYAARLVERGLALPAARAGHSGKSGATQLERRKVSGTPEEFASQDARARAAGLPWATWARRKLSEP